VYTSSMRVFQTDKEGCGPSHDPVAPNTKKSRICLLHTSSVTSLSSPSPLLAQHRSKKLCVKSYNTQHSQVGDKLPDVTLFENTPGESVKLQSLFAGKKVV